MACYLYGLLGSDRRPPSSRGVSDSDVRLVRLTSITAAVSDVDPEAVTEADAERHLDVLLELMADGPVLPARFGLVAPDDAALADDLRPWEATLREQLDRFADLVEVDVTVVEDERVAIEAVLTEQPELARTETGTLTDRVALGEQVAELVLERRAAMADELLAGIRSVVTDDSPRAELTSVEDPVLQWAFLLRRDALGEFDAIVDRLGHRYPSLQLSSVGPLPPFSFSTINLSAEQSAAGHVDEAGSFHSGAWGW